MKTIKDRIKELRRVSAAELIPNPKNHRRHPEAQVKAMRAAFREIGIADAVLAREDSKGRLHLIDGHLRKEELGDSDVPVLVLDVTAKEADKLLATYDAITGLAEIDLDAFAALTEDLNLSDDLQAVVDAFIADEDALRDELNENYTSKIEAPIYEITGNKPSESELVNTEKADALMAKIRNADFLNNEQRAFLTFAAARMNVFNYENIAEYYAHADAEIQNLMEQLALVVIDFDKAIEYGFCTMSEEIANRFKADHE